MIALKSVNTFSRTMDATDRDVRSLTRFTAPRDMRSNTSSVLRPRSSVLATSVTMGIPLIHRATNQRRDNSDRQRHDDDAQRYRY